MPGLLPNVDPDGLLEYSVVYTDRSLNHMSRAFQEVMTDISGTLQRVYGAAAVAVVPGGSANVFARALGISPDPVEATNQLIDLLGERRGGAACVAGSAGRSVADDGGADVWLGVAIDGSLPDSSEGHRL